MQISYEQIRSFVAVADCGSFSAAAKKLGKHRTTLGQLIAHLEIEANMTLFDRSGRYPVLTEDGRALYLQAKNLAETTLAFEQLCMSRERGVESEITVYHTDFLPVGFIASVMSGLREVFPLVRVNWLHRSLSEAKQALQSGEADLGLLLVPNGDSVTAMNFSYLMSLPFCICASPDFVQKHQLTNLDALKRTRQLVAEDFFYSGISKTVSVSSQIERIENLSVLTGLLECGEGWAVLPVHAVLPGLKSGRLKSVDIAELNTLLRFPVCIWQPATLPGPAATELVRLFKAESRLYELQSEGISLGK